MNELAVVIVSNLVLANTLRIQQHRQRPRKPCHRCRSWWQRLDDNPTLAWCVYRPGKSERRPDGKVAVMPRITPAGFSCEQFRGRWPWQ